MLCVVCGIIAGCGAESVETKRAALGSVDIALLDTVDMSGQMVSVGGFVFTPYTEISRGLVLDDGTGRIPIILPESLNLEVGRRLLVQGLVSKMDGYSAIIADSWLYDSTGSAVHSP